jgi:REP element-mobilizing transposase RayT
MTYDPDRHHRRSIRLRGFDYSQNGVYFVTPCVHNREAILGTVHDGAVELSVVGAAIERAWLEIPNRFPFVVLDEYVIMPNHVHALLAFTDIEPDVNRSCSAVAAGSVPPDSSWRTGPAKVTLGRVLRAYKSLSAIQANRLLGRTSQPFWQRDYYDRIVRDDEELQAIRAYIRRNPSLWGDDPANPGIADPL